MADPIILQGITLEQLADAVAARVSPAEEPTMTFTVAQAGRHLNMSRPGVDALIKSGVLVRLPPEVAGHKILITRASLEAAAGLPGT